MTYSFLKLSQICLTKDVTPLKNNEYFSLYDSIMIIPYIFYLCIEILTLFTHGSPDLGWNIYDG